MIVRKGMIHYDGVLKTRWVLKKKKAGMMEQIHVPELAVLKKGKGWLVTFAVLIGFMTLFDYGMLGFAYFLTVLSVYTILLALVLVFISAKQKLLHKIVHGVAYSCVFLMIAGWGGYIVEKYMRNKWEGLSNIFFLISQMGLGFIFGLIIMHIIYMFDSEFEFKNKLLTMRTAPKEDKIIFKDFFGVYFMEIALFYGPFMFFLLTRFFIVDTDTYLMSTETMNILSRAAAFILLYIFFSRKYPHIIQSLRRPQGKWIGWAFLIGIAAFFLTRLVNMFNIFIVADVIQIPAVLKELQEPGIIPVPEMATYNVLRFISIVIIAPIFEEFLFRGFVYTTIRRQHGITKAILFSTAIFAFAHLDIYFRFIPLIMTSIFLPYLYEKSRSLWPCIIVHAMYNFMCVVF
ncbi:MAG: CPBP family intramembrane metalloprotease [Spirochaetes bacterium]|nr:CPBP family intramembrane metalloprotease [Spirochaetota bacterium]